MALLGNLDDDEFIVSSMFCFRKVVCATAQKLRYEPKTASYNDSSTHSGKAKSIPALCKNIGSKETTKASSYSEHSPIKVESLRVAGVGPSGPEHQDAAKICESFPKRATKV